MKKYFVVFYLLALLFVDINADEIELSGDIAAAGMPVLAGFGSIIYEKDLEGAFQLAEAYAGQLALTYSIKFMIDRQRPNGGQYSFPSAHTASAFSSAAFLHKRYGWEIGVPAYLLATYVGWTRVSANKHYPLDVLGGAIIGTSFAYLIPEKFNSEKYSLSFLASEEYFGINYIYKF